MKDKEFIWQRTHGFVLCDVWDSTSRCASKATERCVKQNVLAYADVNIYHNVWNTVKIPLSNVIEKYTGEYIKELNK